MAIFDLSLSLVPLMHNDKTVLCIYKIFIPNANSSLKNQRGASAKRPWVTFRINRKLIHRKRTADTGTVIKKRHTPINIRSNRDQDFQRVWATNRFLQENTSTRARHSHRIKPHVNYKKTQPLGGLQGSMSPSNH